MKQAVSFEFSGYSINNESGAISFLYTINFDDSSHEEFTEKLLLPNPISQKDQELTKKIISNLHIILGISYYKLYCPKKIIVKTFSLTQTQAEFWNTVYTKGLGEFFYKNKIDFNGLIKFPFENTSVIPAEAGINIYRSPIGSGMTGKKDNGRALIPFGGGKDSIVTVELLKKEGTQITIFTLNPHLLQTAVIEKIGVKHISVKRELDSKLFELNKSGSVYNGHIPITAIYSFIALLVAQLFGFNQIVMSNEKSANYGNVAYMGTIINHQWSKSEEFEKMLASYIGENITSDIRIYSRLRPYYEIDVVRQFASLPQYFTLFSSCNTNFKITQTSDKKWCGHCPKCAFVFACLSAFIDKDQLFIIFGKNLYEDESLVKLYKQLLGVADMKPFECVGTPYETQVALFMAYQKGTFNETPIIKMFIKDVMSIIKDISVLKNSVFAVSNYENMPSSYKKIITP